MKILVYLLVIFEALTGCKYNNKYLHKDTLNDQTINMEDNVSENNVSEKIDSAAGMKQLTLGNDREIATKKKALELLYQYLYSDSEYASYGYLFTENEEGIPVLNTDSIDYEKRLGYYVVLFPVDKEENTYFEKFENYAECTIKEGNVEGLILEYTGISDDGKYFEFWLYNYILDWAPEGHGSTLNFYWVSMENGSIYCERTDE